MNRTNEEFLAEADDDWMKDDLSLFPRARTAHAAALVGNELIIHGGMGWDEKINDWDTSTDWETFGVMVGQTQGSVFFSERNQRATNSLYFFYERLRRYY